MNDSCSSPYYSNLIQLRQSPIQLTGLHIQGRFICPPYSLCFSPPGAPFPICILSIFKINSACVSRPDQLKNFQSSELFILDVSEYYNNGISRRSFCKPIKTLNTHFQRWRRKQTDWALPAVASSLGLSLSLSFAQSPKSLCTSPLSYLSCKFLFFVLFADFRLIDLISQFNFATDILNELIVYKRMIFFSQNAQMTLLIGIRKCLFP